MGRKKILFICGSLNQTTMMHQVANHLMDEDCFFTPYYAGGPLKLVARTGFMDNTIAGRGKFRIDTLKYLDKHGLPLDDEGRGHRYDLVVTCSDLIVPWNIRSKKIVLVQEGMTDPMTFASRIIKVLKLPGWMAGNTSCTGLSDRYVRFCVASPGYADFFVDKGAKREKLVVTGIPNFDNVAAYQQNDFPHRDFVLVATSDMRETYKHEDRRKTIEDALNIAAGRQLIFKLHPNENHERATREINQWAPRALVFRDGNVHHMIANCAALITKYSTVVFTASALGKEIHCELDLGFVKRVTPIQNGGRSGLNISAICRELL